MVRFYFCLFMLIAHSTKDSFDLFFFLLTTGAVYVQLTQIKFVGITNIKLFSL